MMDTKQYQKLLFEVEKKKTSDLTGLTTLASRHSHATVMTEPDSGVEQVIAFVGPDYQLVKNEELLIPLHNALSDNHDLDIKTSMWNHSQFDAKFIIKDKKQEIILNDTIFPMVKIKNSYDGRVRLNIQMGFFRLICSNGLTAPIGEMRELQGIHTQSINEIVTKYIDFVGEFLNISKTAAEAYQPLLEKKIDENLLETIIAQVTKGTKFPKRQIESAIDIMHVESEKLRQPMNSWLVYNGLNNIIHDDEVGLDITKADSTDALILDNLLELS